MAHDLPWRTYEDRSNLPLILLNKIDEKMQADRISIKDKRWDSLFKPGALMRRAHPTPMSRGDCIRAFNILSYPGSVSTRLIPVTQFPSVRADYKVVIAERPDDILEYQCNSNCKHKCVCPFLDDVSRAERDERENEVDIMKHALLEVLSGVNEIPWANPGEGEFYCRYYSRKPGSERDCDEVPADDLNLEHHWKAKNLAYVEVSVNNIKFVILVCLVICTT